MADNGRVSGIMAALAIGVPALIAFHEYSTYLSSPWTTQKLSEAGDEDSLWRLYWEATTATMLWTGAVGVSLAWSSKKVWPFVTSMLSAGLVSLWIWFDYDRALKGEL